MAVLFSLVFTLVLLAIGFAFFCIPCGLTWLAIDQLALSRLNKKTRIALPLVLMPLAYALLIILIALWLTRPAGVYKMAFGVSPASDVSITSSSHSGIGDFGEHHLTFTAGKQTINDLLRRKFKTSLEDSTPDKDGWYRFKQEYSETFASEISKLEYSPETREARYEWEGID